MFSLDNTPELTCVYPSQGEMDLWIQKVNSVTGAEGTSIPSKSQTLPARMEGEKKEEHKKKKGFLTLKKK